MPSRTFRAFVFPVFLLALAGMVVTLMATLNPRPAAATASADPPAIGQADQQAIEKLAQDYAFAWSTHDVDGLVRLYAPDATVRSAAEGGAHGTEALRPFLERRLGEPDSDSRATVDVQAIEPLAPGLAMVDVVRRISQVTSNEPVSPIAPGAPNPPPGVPTDRADRPVETQVSRGAWIVANTGDGWRIRSERAYPDPHTCAMQGIGGAGTTIEPSPATEPLTPRFNAPLPPPERAPVNTPLRTPASPYDPSRSPWQTPGGY